MTDQGANRKKDRHLPSASASAFYQWATNVYWETLEMRCGPVPPYILYISPVWALMVSTLCTLQERDLAPEEMDGESPAYD